MLFCMYVCCVLFSVCFVVVVVAAAAAAVTSSDPGGEKEQQKPNVECCTHVLFPNKTANFSTDGWPLKD